MPTADRRSRSDADETLAALVSMVPKESRDGALILATRLSAQLSEQATQAAERANRDFTDRLVDALREQAGITIEVTRE